MRITSDFWVSALTRRVFAEGGFAAVDRRGAAEAGAIFVVTRNRLGQSTLFGPAPQSAYDSARPDDRQFTALIADAEAAAIEARIAKESGSIPTSGWSSSSPDRRRSRNLLNLTRLAYAIRLRRLQRLAERFRLARIVGRQMRLRGRRRAPATPRPASPPSSREPCPPRPRDGTDDSARGTAGSPRHGRNCLG